MDIKRVLTALIGIPLVILVIIFGNKYLIDIILMLMAIISMYEYLKVIEKVAHPIGWVGYLSTIIIALVAIPIIEQNIMKILVFSIPFIILLLFEKVIITNMETNFKDVAYTFLGICYVTLFILFLGLILNLKNGKILFGYMLSIAWSTDTIAYLCGKKFGKHHFSKISPNKTIEGCVSGTFGAVVISIIYIFLVNRYLDFQILDLNISQLLICTGIISLIFSLISQAGDLIASSIKRFSDTKDYGNLLPGHGGMLDRIDSLMFMAPFVYIVFSFIM